MEYDLQTGITNTVSMTVEQKDTAAAVASGLAEVLATPTMIAVMEQAAYRLVEDLLPEGISTVGTQIDAKHIAATPVGMNVKATATLTQVEGRKLVFEIEAFDDVEKVGEASHTRFIIKSDKFLAKAYAKKG